MFRSCVRECLRHRRLGERGASDAGEVLGDEGLQGANVGIHEMQMKDSEKALNMLSYWNSCIARMGSRQGRRRPRCCPRRDIPCPTARRCRHRRRPETTPRWADGAAGASERRSSTPAQYAGFRFGSTPGGQRGSAGCTVQGLGCGARGRCRVSPEAGLHHGGLPDVESAACFQWVGRASVAVAYFDGSEGTRRRGDGRCGYNCRWGCLSTTGACGATCGAL